MQPIIMESYTTESGHQFPDEGPGTQFTSFTSFTSTKVQKLTLQAQLGEAVWALTSVHRYSVYLLYWYKSTKTGAVAHFLGHVEMCRLLLSLLALLVHGQLLRR